MELVGQSMIQNKKLSKTTENDDVEIDGEDNSASSSNCCNGGTGNGTTVSPQNEQQEMDNSTNGNNEEDMEIGYSNGYQNGCGDDMGKSNFNLLIFS